MLVQKVVVFSFFLSFPFIFGLLVSECVYDKCVCSFAYEFAAESGKQIFQLFIAVNVALNFPLMWAVAAEAV